jgi:long-chain acyl-CoA synthetase
MSDEKLPLEMFKQWVSQQPDRVYMHQPIDRVFKNYSWKEVNDQVSRMAAYLVGKNYPVGSNIAIVSKNCAHWIMADYAIWMAGHVSVPLYPNLTAETTNQILVHSEAKFAFIGKLDGFAKLKPGIPSDLECVNFPYDLYKTTNDYTCWDQVVKDTQPLKDIVPRSHDDLATIIYTSGTTGMPKGVMHSFRALSFAGANSMRDVGFSKTDRCFSYLPLSHVAERLLIEVGGLYTGGEIYFAESLDTFKDDMVNSRPTGFLAVPRIWTKFQDGILKKLPQKKLNLLLSVPLVSSLIRKKVKSGLGLDKAWIFASGAAPISPSTLKWFDRLGLRIQEAYGMTENMAYSHYVRRGNWQPGTVGQPFPGVMQRISDEGEIQVKSNADMLGYFKEPEKTKEMFTDDGWIKTGDQGQIASDGTLKITGRVKDLFKTSKGKYVAPAPIELKMQASEHIENICIVGSGLPQPIALVMLSEVGQASPEESLDTHFKELIQSVNSTLDSHERMQRVVVVKDEWTIENGILTPSMKIKRNVVESRYEVIVEKVESSGASVVWERKI